MTQAFLGNGGVNNEVDWTGSDPVALQKESHEAEHLLKTQPIKQTTSRWIVIMNSGLIQWETNFFERLVKKGFIRDLSDVSVI